MDILLIFPGFILAIIIMMIYEIKLRKQQNKVHFYVTKGKRICVLWFGKPKLIEGSFESSNNNNFIIAYQKHFSDFGLNINDYLDMKEREIREVYINLED